MGQGIDLLGALTRLVPERAALPVDPARMRRVLIVKLTSVGDVVHALPVATALRRAHPTLEISWAVADWTSPLVLGHPAIDRVIVMPTWTSRIRTSAGRLPLGRAVRELRRTPFDVILDLQGLAKSALVSRVARGQVRLARAGQREGAHLVARAVPLPPRPAHAVDEYLAVARFLGASTDPVRFDLPVDPASLASTEAKLARAGIDRRRPLIVVCPSTAKGWRRWPPERWATVVDWLGQEGEVVLSGRRDQHPYHSAVLSRARARVTCFTGQTTLGELVALLHVAQLHVAPDTGSVHIAAALGTPAVALFGPTAAWRLAPFGQAHLAVDHGNLCGPGCPAYCTRRRQCIDSIMAEEVIEKAKLALAEGRKTGSSHV